MEFPPSIAQPLEGSLPRWAICVIASVKSTKGLCREVGKRACACIKVQALSAFELVSVINM
eukprot:6060618-Pyramimonas_sp.AAC.1